MALAPPDDSFGDIIITVAFLPPQRKAVPKFLAITRWHGMEIGHSRVQGAAAARVLAARAKMLCSNLSSLVIGRLSKNKSYCI